MKNKRLSALVYGLLAIQILIPTYGASEVEQTNVQQAEVKYAPNNPTPAQVKAAAPTDLVNIPDPALAEVLDLTLAMSGAPITVADMERLNSILTYNSNISDLTGLEYAVNLSNFDVAKNNISDLTPLSNLKEIIMINVNENQVSDLSPIVGLPKLMMLSAMYNNISDVSPILEIKALMSAMLGFNNISDITPLKDSTNLQFIQLTGNHISDLSPLANPLTAGTLLTVDVNNQTVNAPDIVVNTNEEVKYDIINVDGSKVTVTLGTPAYGLNEYKDVVVDNFNYQDKVQYSATVSQKVTYVTLTGTETDSINESTTAMTDEELITLFNVVSSENKVITVDQSAVNYDVPGTYDVIFDNGIDTVTSKLTVSDIKPTMSLTTDTVTIKLGATIDDYITTFGAVATELTDGDLTNKIAVNDSAVNYNQAGNYEVTLSVTDAEGNEVSQTGYVTIEDDTPVTPVEPDSEASEEANSEASEEVNSEASEEVNSEASEEINSEASEETNSEVSSDTNSEVSSDTNAEKESTTTKAEKDTKVMTDSNKKALASTGGLSTVLFILLSAVTMMVVSIKKTIATKN